MNDALRSVKEKVEQTIFTGRAQFERHEIQAIGDIMSDAQKMYGFITETVEDIQSEDIDIINAAADALALVVDAKKLVEINELPKHFTEMFNGLLGKISENLYEIRRNKIRVHSNAIVAELYSNEIGEH